MKFEMKCLDHILFTTGAAHLSRETSDINSVHSFEDFPLLVSTDVVPQFCCSVILFPIAVTFYVTWWFFRFVDGFFSPIYAHLGINIFGMYGTKKCLLL